MHIKCIYVKMMKIPILHLKINRISKMDFSSIDEI